MIYSLPLLFLVCCFLCVVYSAAFGLDTHKDIVNAASGLQVQTGPQMSESLIDGVVYNDMPQNSDAATHKPISVAKFLLNIHDEESTVFNSHYGCLQLFHGMTPVVSGYPDVTFRNDQLRDLILYQLKLWWDKAVEYTHHRRDTTFGDSYIGRIFHTVQDLHSRAHTVRGLEPIYADSYYGKSGLNFRYKEHDKEYSFHLDRLKCGEIYYFQGYQIQRGSVLERKDPTYHSYYDRSAHAEGWESGDDARQKDLYECSIFASSLILRYWHRCRSHIRRCDVSWKKVHKLLRDQVVRVSPLTASVTSGGTWATIADESKIEKSKYRATKFIISGRPVTVHVPTSRQVWNDPNGDLKVPLCDHVPAVTDATTKSNLDFINPVGKISRLASGASCSDNRQCKSNFCSEQKCAACSPDDQSCKTPAAAARPSFCVLDRSCPTGFECKRFRCAPISAQEADLDSVELPAERSPAVAYQRFSEVEGVAASSNADQHVDVEVDVNIDF